jgi:hypothetical protein
MSFERLRHLGFFLGLLGLAGCPGTLNDPAAFEVEASSSCDDVPDVVFTPRCALSGCHTASMSAGSLDLASPDVYARLVGQPATGGPGVLIDPGGDPANSVLYLKLTPSPPFGSQMPLTGTKLDATTLACVANWITTRGSIDGSAPSPDSSQASDASPDPDAGTTDAEMPVDSGTPDVSTGPEASTTPDGSTTPDATTTPEASTMPDGSANHDSGGSMTDAASKDASSGEDSGNDDAGKDAP